MGAHHLAVLVVKVTVTERLHVGTNRGKAVGVLAALNSMKVYRNIDKVAHAGKKLGDVP